MTIAERLARVRQRIEQAATRAGRDPSEPRLVAVSKIHSPESVREAYEAGQRLFGENYVQELREKQQSLGDLDDLKWHFIGHLQRNKVRQVVGSVDLIETIDSQRLLDEVARRAENASVDIGILVQVNIRGEESKSGCDPEGLGELLEAVDRQRRVVLRGLMVLPPFELEAEETRPYFSELRELRERHGGAAALPELSMGMSHDFEVAIEEGATLVRVGTAIFGPRGR